MKKDALLNVTLVLLTLCALTTTTLVARRELLSRPTIGAHNEPHTVSHWRQYSQFGHRVGSATAAATIVVFSDYQCPYCARLTQALRSVQEKYGPDVAIVYRNFPLHLHAYAIAAAEASECAAEQGRFEAFHLTAFALQDSIGQMSWPRFAERAEVPDIGRFQNCLNGRLHFAALARDTLDAKRLGVRGTPTLLINNVELQGALPFDTLSAYIDHALRSSRERLDVHGGLRRQFSDAQFGPTRLLRRVRIHPLPVV
jgi:glutaredoxin